MSFSEVLRRLKKLDEITLLELLDVTSEELVEAFIERIEERLDYVTKELEGLE